jgi:hypothetical protein
MACRCRGAAFAAAALAAVLLTAAALLAPPSGRVGGAIAPAVSAALRAASGLRAAVLPVNKKHKKKKVKPYTSPSGLFIQVTQTVCSGAQA